MPYTMFTRDDLPDKEKIEQAFDPSWKKLRTPSKFNVELIDIALDNGYAILANSPDRIEKSWLMPQDIVEKAMTFQQGMRGVAAMMDGMSSLGFATKADGTASVDLREIDDLVFTPSSNAPSYFVEMWHVLPTSTPAIPMSFDDDPSWRSRSMSEMISEFGTPNDIRMQHVHSADMVSTHDGTAAFGRESDRRRTPLTFGAIKDDKLMVQAFMRANADKPLVRDIDRDFPDMARTSKVPAEMFGVSMSDVLGLDTKQQLLQKTFSRKVPPIANKCHLAAGVSAAAVSPRLSEKTKARLWQGAANADGDTIGTLMEVNEFEAGGGYSSKAAWLQETRNSGTGYALAYPKLADCLLPGEHTDATDYSLSRTRHELVDMSKMLYEMGRQKMPDDINSERRLHERHQDVSHAHRIVEHQHLADEVLDVTNSRYRKVDEALSAVGFERLTTGLQMYEEGERMHHCVFSYKDRMLHEDSAFYTGVINGDRHTLQVTLTNDGPRINQMYRMYDRVRTEEADNAVHLALDVSSMPKRERARAIEAIIDAVEAADEAGAPVCYSDIDLTGNAIRSAHVLPDGTEESVKTDLGEGYSEPRDNRDDPRSYDGPEDDGEGAENEHQDDDEEDIGF